MSITIWTTKKNEKIKISQNVFPETDKTTEGIKT